MMNGSEPVNKAYSDALQKARDFAEALMRRTLEAKIDPETYVDLSSLGLSELATDSGPLDERQRRQLLINLGVVGGAQGTSRVWIEKGAQTSLNTTLAGASAVLDELTKKEQLSREELHTAISATGADETRVLNVLKALDLVAGAKGRNGGVKRADVAAKDFAAAETEIARAEDKERREPDKVSEHESIYYPAAADALRLEGFEATVTGVRQRGQGEWSTPDVVGYYVRPTAALIVPIVRVGTVEVKHRLSRAAIAEAAAQRRFAHYSYVAAAEVFADISAELREECVRAGIGLMCFRQRNSAGFSVFLEPMMNRPDEEAVEELLASLRAEDGLTFAEHILTEVRRGMGQQLFR